MAIHTAPFTIVQFLEIRQSHLVENLRIILTEVVVRSCLYALRRSIELEAITGSHAKASAVLYVLGTPVQYQRFDFRIA
jgi:hypothetical protein